jgi:ribosomal protein S11
MNITKFFLTGILSAVALLSMATIAYAEDGQTGDAIYANGGIGQEESDEMRAKAGNYNLRLYMAEGKHGHSITDTQVTITDKKGNVVLDVPSAGPMLFVQVKNGTYMINANYAGTTITRKVAVVNRRGTNVHLLWKTTDTNPDTED